jgi:hypothetical protein
MTEGSPDTALDDDEMRALLDRPLSELSVAELMALKDAYTARGIRIYNSLQPADALLIAAAASYVTLFTQTLAAHNAAALIRAVQTRFRRKGKILELVVGTDDDAAAAFLVTADLPDDAKLAMLEVDVTSDELRGKLLRWNDKVMAWRPYESQE